MRHSLPKAPQFYVTAPQECPYLENQIERKLFTSLNGLDAQILNNALSIQGFRRSQNVLYRPSCADCTACLSARIPVTNFHLTKSEKRVITRNNLLKREIKTPWATSEHFELFKKICEAPT
jgi:arginine-tRNA-protein transferase